MSSRGSVVSSEPGAHSLQPMKSLTMAELAALQQVQPVASVEKFAADIWDSDEELDEFLHDLRSSRYSRIA
jgi:hypothetical protein